jgi:hypothetical protein
MQNRNIYLFLVLIFHISLSAQEKGSGWSYHFPLDLKPKVSGSFGEIRSNHFHSGLDVTTNGKTGLPVFSADKGYVSRIAVSPGGFGKALYIDHPSGFTTVYAHLESFSPRLDSLVLALQYQKKSFTINEYFQSGQFPVNRGEVVAFSGNSGSSGGPHLHFEVRETDGQKPMDPLAFPTPVKDDVRPHIGGIKLYPIGDGSTINGENESVFYPAVFYDGAFHLKHNPKIRASGIIGVGIEVIDYLSGSWRKCGVHSIDLAVNDEPVYSYVMDGFYFHDTRFINSHIDFAEKMNTGRTIQKSFLDKYNSIDLYKVDSQRGRVTINPGTDTEFAYLIKDVAGNTSPLSFNITGDRFMASKTETSNSQLLIDAGNDFSFETEGHSVHMEKGTFYEDVAGDISVRESFISESGTVFSILDKTIPVHKRFEIKIPLPDNLEAAGLCGAVLDGNLKPQYAGGKKDGSHFVIESRVCGDFLLVKDTIAPVLYIKSKPSKMNYKNRSKMVVRLEDDFSGIDGYECFINDQWTLFEYDPKSREMVCYFEKIPFLEKGVHQLTIEAKDNAGNKEVLKTSFNY